MNDNPFFAPIAKPAKKFYQSINLAKRHADDPDAPILRVHHRGRIFYLSDFGPGDFVARVVGGKYYHLWPPQKAARDCEGNLIRTHLTLIKGGA